MYLNNSTFCDNATFKIVALTNGFGYIFDLPTFRASSAGGAATSQFRIGPIYIQKPKVFSMFPCYRCWVFFCSFTKLATRHWQFDAFQGAHAQKMTVCVTYLAPLLGPKNCVFCQRSKTVTFTITFGPHALQTTVGAAPSAHRLFRNMWKNRANVQLS